MSDYLGVVAMLVVGLLGVAAVYLTNRVASVSSITLVSLPFLSGWSPQEHALSRYQ